MKSISKIADGPALSPYTGSEATYNLVASVIKERWGEDEMKNYNPYTNAFTFTGWLAQGYRVKKGEKAIKSITFVEKKDENGNVVKKFKRVVSLFYCKQVEKIES